MKRIISLALVLIVFATMSLGAFAEVRNYPISGNGQSAILRIDPDKPNYVTCISWVKSHTVTKQESTQGNIAVNFWFSFAGSVIVKPLLSILYGSIAGQLIFVPSEGDVITETFKVIYNRKADTFEWSLKTQTKRNGKVINTEYPTETYGYGTICHREWMKEFAKKIK